MVAISHCRRLGHTDRTAVRILRQRQTGRTPEMAAHRGQDAALAKEVVHQGARLSLSGETRYDPYELPRRLSIRDIQLLSVFFCL